MKKLILASALVLLMSCKKEESVEPVKKFTIEVVFNNGDRDTLVVNGSRMHLHEGDLIVRINDYNDHTVASNVRTFEFIKKKNN